MIQITPSSPRWYGELGLPRSHIFLNRSGSDPGYSFTLITLNPGSLNVLRRNFSDSHRAIKQCRGNILSLFATGLSTHMKVVEPVLRTSNKTGCHVGGDFYQYPTLTQSMSACRFDLGVMVCRVLFLVLSFHPILTYHVLFLVKTIKEEIYLSITNKCLLRL